MSCQVCEDNQEVGMGTFVRIGKANVQILGCEEHLKELIRLLRVALEAERD